MKGKIAIVILCYITTSVISEDDVVEVLVQCKRYIYTLMIALGFSN